MTALVGNRPYGRCFVVSAPAGTGKTTLVNMLTSEFPVIVQSISFTTRLPREGEENGKHYYFIGEEEFEAKIADADFLEYVRLYGNYYGTSKRWIQEQLSKGRHVVLVIDTQGAMLLKKIFPAVFIFICPPSLEVLKERLRERKTETPEMIKKRLAWAKVELEAASQYDYVIVNDNLQIAYEILRSIVIAEDHRTSSLK